MAEARGTRTSSGIIGQCAKGLFYIALVGFAVFGVIELMLEAWFGHTGVRWRPEDVNALLSTNSPTRQLANDIWGNIKFLIQYGAYLIAAIAFALAVAQIKAVAKLVSDFIVARGSIYQLAATMTNAEESASRLAEQVKHLSKLEPTIQLTAERIEETLQKLGDLQRLAVSERIDVPADAPAEHATHRAELDDKNWERLRELWNMNGARLDDVIEHIPDKKRRNKFSRMDRRNYPAIINGLADQNLISQTAREGSLKLHATFVGYRPRNRDIPDHVIGDLEVADTILENELATARRAPVATGPAPNSVENATEGAI